MGADLGAWLRAGREGKLSALKCSAVSVNRHSLNTSIIKREVLAYVLFSNPSSELLLHSTVARADTAFREETRST